MLLPWELLCAESQEANQVLEGLLEVAAADPLIFDEFMRGILSNNEEISIKAAESVEKITRVRPLFLTPYKRVLVKEVAEIEVLKVRQQVAILYGRGIWDEWDMKQVVTLLKNWIESQEDEHIIINALQSLYTLAMQKEWIRPILSQQLENAMTHSNLSVRNIAKKLHV